MNETKPAKVARSPGLPIREAELNHCVKVQRGPRTAAAIQPVGAGLPTQVRDQCDKDVGRQRCFPALAYSFTSHGRCSDTVPLRGIADKGGDRTVRDLVRSRTPSEHAPSAIIRLVAIVIPWSAPGTQTDVDEAGQPSSSGPSANATDAESRCEGQGATGEQGFGHTDAEHVGPLRSAKGQSANIHSRPHLSSDALDYH